MARLASTILQSLISKLPTGFAFGFRGGVLDAVLEAAAAPIADIEVGAEAMMVEADPRSANNLLADFERVLGPDPCGRDLGGLSVADRQKLAHQRWTATGGQSIPYLVQLAANLGVSITIEEFWPSRAGSMRAGRPVRSEGCQFVFRVHVPGLVTVVNLKAGSGRAGQRLGSFQLSSIECDIRRVKPAHTQVTFAYGEA
ncbi:Mu-like prophage protein [Rhizobium phaseoli]|uniref:YmfQ family protein n=1 Tax=Rhizobium phaseoli TaxID=396 RepID=UPI0007EA7137|nr:putative phage tail protein [Rhizobium phaseoli]ANM05219.1 Mu-like prophage protein [Rhizobium phaseoli]